MGNKTGIGYVQITLSSLIHAVMPMYTVLLFNAGVSDSMILLICSIVVIPVFFFLTRAGKEKLFDLSWNQVWKLVLFSLLGLVVPTLLMYASLVYVGTGVATTIHFTYPIFVLIGGVLFFRDKITIKTVLCFVLCLIGVLLFLEKADSPDALLGIILSILSGAIYGIYILILGKFNIIRDMSINKINFYYNVFGAVMLVIYGLFTKSLNFNYNWKVWLALIGYSVLLGVFGTTFFQRGVKNLGSLKASLLSTLEPILTIVVGIIFLNEELTWKSAIGSVLVVVAVLLQIIFDSQEQRKLLGKESSEEK